MPEDKAPHRTGDEAHRERGERQHGPDAVVELGEIQVIENESGHNPIEEEVVPFDDGPYEGRNDDATKVFVVFDLFCGFHAYSLRLVLPLFVVPKKHNLCH